MFIAELSEDTDTPGEKVRKILVTPEVTTLKDLLCTLSERSLRLV